MKTSQTWNLTLDELLYDEPFLSSLLIYENNERNRNEAAKQFQELNLKQDKDAKNFVAGTNINGAIIEALERVRLLNEAEEPGKTLAATIVILTDGGPIAGETNPSVILENIRKANSLNTPIFSMAFSNNVTENYFNLIQNISMQNHGSAHYVHNPSGTLILESFIENVVVKKRPILRDLSFTYDKEDSTIFRSIIDRDLSTMYQGSEHCNIGVVDDTNAVVDDDNKRLFHAKVRALPYYVGGKKVILVSQLLYLKSI